MIDIGNYSIMKPLTQYKTGNKLKIIKIDAGKSAIMNLLQLGLNIGDIIEIKRKSLFKGPITVESQGAEIALGYGLSEKILVNEFDK